VQRIKTHTFCTIQIIKTDTTEQLTATLEVEQQGYRHFLNTAVHYLELIHLFCFRSKLLNQKR